MESTSMATTGTPVENAKEGPVARALRLAEEVSPRMDPWEFWRDTLKSPKHVMAPMVDASDLAYRRLSRLYDTHLTYTPMIHTKAFNSSKKLRKRYLWLDPSDKPCIAQLAGNSVEDLLTAAKFAQEHDIEAIDINLGCPQRCARSGGYGAFLMNHPDLVFEIVRTLVRECRLPITCKMRIFPDLEETMAFAKGLERSGCSILTVHGRTKEQKGQMSGPCNWDIIKRIKAELKIPVISNGGIQKFSDVADCLAYTGCDAVMSADALLRNPGFFLGIPVDPFLLLKQYIHFFRDRPELNRKFVNTHVQGVLIPQFVRWPDLRTMFFKTLNSDWDVMLDVLDQINELVKVRSLIEEPVMETPVVDDDGPLIVFPDVIMTDEKAPTKRSHDDAVGEEEEHLDPTSKRARTESASQ